ncbi:uncharacterized protein LOC144592429 [Rhinoraja longicauda]
METSSDGVREPKGMLWGGDEQSRRQKKERSLWGSLREKPANKVVLWEPTHGRRNPGRANKTMLKTLMEDAYVETKEELASCMEVRDVWGVHHCARRNPAPTRR